MLTMHGVPEHERRRLFDMAEAYLKEIIPRTRVGPMSDFGNIFMVIAINLFGDGLLDALDPRLRM